MTSEMNLDQAIESKLAKTINKIVLPALATVAITVITWMVQDIRSGLAEVQVKQTKQGDEIGSVRSDVQVVNAKLDNGVIWRIGELERRLNTVEQAQKTP